MNVEVFKNPSLKFSVQLFIQPEDVEIKKAELEALGRQRNVRLIVQPCPFEGIEFLYRIADQLIGHHISMDKEIFWQAIALKGETPDPMFLKISDHHHQFLCAILEQDVPRVKKERKALESLAEYYL